MVASVVLACNIAMAQNWVSSGTPGSPVIPFDALATGWSSPAGPPLLPKAPLYTCRGGSTEGYGLQVGLYAPGSKFCQFGFGGKEISVLDFEFLVTSWQSESGGVIPPNAVQGGLDEPAGPTGPKRPLYYCRGKVGIGPHGAPPLSPISLQLGKIGVGLGGCVVPYSGREVLLGIYDVLVNLNPAMPLATIPEINGFVPQDAIRAGTDVDGTPLYICSAILDGNTYPGKLHSSFAGCNISVAGVEHTISSYSVLRPDWLGVPKFDFPAGIDIDGAALHVCRAFLNDGEYPGKTRQNWDTCNVGLAGLEQTSKVYEILSH